MIAPRDDSDAFPITAAQLTGLYFETLAYGMYLVTCCFCAQTLFWIAQPGGGERLRRRSEVQWMLVSVFCFIFVVSTFDDIIGMIHIIIAFVKYKGAGGPEEEFTNIRDWLNIVRTIDQAANMIMGDFILIYRCYVVYGRRWTVITPSFMLYLTGIATAVKLIVVQITTSNTAITLNSNVIKPWSSAFFAINAAQNILTTSLLVWRIWRVERRNEKFRAGNISLSAPIDQSRLRKVIRVVAESGLAYSTLVFMTFVADVCNSNTQYPFATTVLQATGITFNVIIIRSTPRREDEFTDFEKIERGIAAQNPGRAFNTLQFRSHSTADRRKVIENGKINITIQHTTDRFDRGDTQVDGYSMDDFAAK
ncbi:hypothetical protein MVEN_01365900 [Mycena venus]|uniref:Uncharacterized protein n=1 Tax=Mycena venus TaxID=2733690 RepID=A0A8H6XYE1_9AGAR|nr:hypothetical protein MVEN_01365900 [Mycena venus]